MEHFCEDSVNTKYLNDSGMDCVYSRHVKETLYMYRYCIDVKYKRTCALDIIEPL